MEASLKKKQSHWGHFEIVNLLLVKGVEVNHQNKVSYS